MLWSQYVPKTSHGEAGDMVSLVKCYQKKYEVLSLDPIPM